MIGLSGIETEAGRYLAHSLWQGPVLLLAYLGLRRQRAQLRADASCRAAALAVVLLASLPLLTGFTALLAAAAPGSMVASTGSSGTLVPVPHNMLLLLERHLTMNLAQALLLVWVAGVFLAFLHLVLSVWRLNRLLARAGRPVVLPGIASLAARVGLPVVPEFREWKGATAPFVAGWLCPIVVLPPGLQQLLTAGELEAVLLHELAHVRRRDVRSNLWLRVLGCFAWHQLPLWKLMGDLARDREHCCDELAIRAMGKSLPLARALLTLEERRSAQPRLVMAGTGGDFAARVRRIVAQGNRMGRIHRGASLALATLLIVTASTLLVAASAEGQLEAWANNLHARITASDPAGPFTVELIGRRMVGATIDGVPVPAERIVQQGERVQLLNPSGHPELTLDVWPAGIHWSPRPPRSP